MLSKGERGLSTLGGVGKGTIREGHHAMIAKRKPIIKTFQSIGIRDLSLSFLVNNYCLDGLYYWSFFSCYLCVIDNFMIGDNIDINRSYYTF